MDGEERETSDREVERPKWTKEITPSVTHDEKIDEDDHGDDRAAAQPCAIGSAPTDSMGRAVRASLALVTIDHQGQKRKPDKGGQRSNRMGHPAENAKRCAEWRIPASKFLRTLIV
jgi:hypothetical protein